MGRRGRREGRAAGGRRRGWRRREPGRQRRRPSNHARDRQPSPGGAERQVVYTASRLKARGFARCEIVVTDDLGDPRGDYRAMLDAAGVVARRAGDAFDARVAAALRDDAPLRDAASRLPAALRPRAADLFGEFVAARPHIVHCWLDHTNIWGGVAAALAGVPAIVLSTRSLNPRHFPHLYQPWFDEWYHVLAMLPNVHLINNSRPGAADYAAWLGLPPERFTVILNGLDLSAMRRADERAVAAFRDEIAARPGDRLLVSVFRIGDEKQPHIFAAVAERLLAEFADLRIVVAGTGPMEGQMRALARRGPNADRFHLVGARRDVPTVLSAASLFLLTSRVEGTPNVLLEAQHLGCPAVTTAAGGAVDAVLDGVTGVVRPIGDLDGLADACARLLRDEPRRAAMAGAGPAFVAARFGMERMIDETLGVYERALGRTIGRSRPG
ncbi:MAG: glycosyltransferase [Phycisphaerales bacterium]